MYALLRVVSTFFFRYRTSLLPTRMYFVYVDRQSGFFQPSSLFCFLTIYFAKVLSGVRWIEEVLFCKRKIKIKLVRASACLNFFSELSLPVSLCNRSPPNHAQFSWAACISQSFRSARSSRIDSGLVKRVRECCCFPCLLFDVRFSPDTIAFIFTFDGNITHSRLFKRIV